MKLNHLVRKGKFKTFSLGTCIFVAKLLTVLIGVCYVQRDNAPDFAINETLSHNICILTNYYNKVHTVVRWTPLLKWSGLSKTIILCVVCKIQCPSENGWFWPLFWVAIICVKVNNNSLGQGYQGFDRNLGHWSIVYVGNHLCVVCFISRWVISNTYSIGLMARKKLQNAQINITQRHNKSSTETFSDLYIYSFQNIICMTECATIVSFRIAFKDPDFRFWFTSICLVTH